MDSRQEPLVSIIIPTHNRKKKLLRLLNSIFNSSYSNLDIIVIDDASSENASIEIRSQFPLVKIIRNHKELFPSMCRNIGIKQSKGNFVLLIDDDNIIHEKSLSELVKTASNSKIGLVGPIMYYYSDPDRIWCAGAKLNRLLFTHKQLNEDRIDKGLLQTTQECDYFPNAFMLRKNVLDEVGYFDTFSFPQAFEEIDLAERVRKAGYKVVLAPTAKIWHDIPVLANKPHRPSKIRAYLRGRSRIMFYRKYAPWRLTFLMFDIFMFSLRKISYKNPWKEKKAVVRYFLRGIVDGLFA